MNKKLIIFLSAFFLFSCEGAKERQAFYLEKAKDSIESKSIKKAKIDLKNVLQIDPKNSEALYLMGAIFEDEREYEKAYKYYVRAIEYDEKNIDARFRLARIYMLSSQHDKVEAEIEKIEIISPEHVYIKSLKLAIQYGNKNFDVVIKIGDTINDSDKTENVYEMYAASFYRLGDLEKSISILEQAINQYADNIMLRSTLASLYEEAGDNKKAHLIYQDIIDVDKEKNPQHYVNLSNFFRKNNEIDKADNVYVELTHIDPENEKYQMMRAYYIGEKYGIKKAIAHMVSLIEEFPDHDNYKVSLARLYYKNNDINEAANIIENILKGGYSDKSITQARNFLAMMALASGDFDKAEAELSKVQEINPNNVEANLLLGKISLSKKKFGEAIKFLRVVVRESPTNADAFVYLAQALEFQGDSELARDVLAKGFRSSPKDMELASSFIKILMRRGEYGYSLKLLESLPLNDVATFDQLRLKANVYFLNKNYRKSLELAKLILAKHPKMGEGYLVAADSHVKLGQHEEAIKIMHKGLDLKLSAKLLIGYSNVMKALGRTEELIGFLKSYQEYKPVVYNLLAELYGLSDRMKDAIYYYNQSINLNPKWDAPYLALAALYNSKGEIEKAVETLNNGLNLIGDNLKIQLMLADIYLGSSDFDKSIKLYNEILSKDPENIVAINNLALILVDEFDDKDKSERAYDLVKKIEKNETPVIIDTVGWVYAKSGRHEGAISFLSKLVNDYPDVQVFKYHLGMTYYYKGDLEKANEILNVFVGKKMKKEAWVQDINRVVNEFSNAH